MSQINMRQMIEAGVKLGKKKSLWKQKMQK